LRRIGAGRRDIVDVAGLVLIPSDQTDRRRVSQWQIDESLESAARTPVFDEVALDVVGGLEDAELGLVRDDADGAGLRTRPVQRALRARQRLNAGDVVKMQIE